jgi:hypothetical protein
MKVWLLLNHYYDASDVVGVYASFDVAEKERFARQSPTSISVDYEVIEHFVIGSDECLT